MRPAGARGSWLSDPGGRVREPCRASLENDRFPQAPRLDPLRAALGKLDPATAPKPTGVQQTPVEAPRQPKPTSGRGPPRQRLRCPPASSWAGCRPIADRRRRGSRGRGSWAAVNRRAPMKLAAVHGDSPACQGVGCPCAMRVGLRWSCRRNCCIGGVGRPLGRSGFRAEDRR